MCVCARALDVNRHVCCVCYVEVLQCMHAAGSGYGLDRCLICR